MDSYLITSILGPILSISPEASARTRLPGFRKKVKWYWYLFKKQVKNFIISEHFEFDCEEYNRIYLVIQFQFIP